MDELLQYATHLANQTSHALSMPIKGRVAYVVSHGQSYASNGYAIRTQGVAKALNQHGFETLCFVRPGRPWELNQNIQPTPPEVTLQGVRYIHSRWPNDVVPSNEREHLEGSVQQFMTLFSVYRPEVVLAASNWIVGLPAWVAAKRLGLPFYNEVRGFWELSRAAQDPAFESSKTYQIEAERDTFVAKQGLTTFTLNAPMQEELVKRGVRRENIQLVPNGVSELPNIAPADSALKKRLGIQEGDKVVGYIGSHSVYEGLDTLIAACEALVQQGQKIKLLLVGDHQPITQAHKANKANVKQPWLIQTGRVPHEEVANYYALIDLVVIPRKPFRVCELVPPMKLLEALAFCKKTIVSNIAALSSYADAFSNVSVFDAESSRDLSIKIQESLQSTEMVHKPGKDLVFNVSCIVESVETNSKSKSGVSLNTYSQAEENLHSSLKKYSRQPSLEAENRTERNSSFVSLGNVRVAGDSFYEIKKDVVEKENYCLELKCLADIVDKKGIVADLVFYDKNGTALPKPYPGLAKSKKFGAYFYIESQNKNELERKAYKFSTPDFAVSVTIRLHSFNLRNGFDLIDGYAILTEEEKIKELSSGSKYLEAFESLLVEARSIPDSNGSEYFTKHDFRVGVIGDVYMYNFYKDVFSTVYYLSPDNYKDVLDNDLDIIIYTTCWKGIDNEEWKGVKFREKPKKALDEILRISRIKNAKTVFQTIEDPSNFDYFLPIAKKFDYILTTDTDCIEKYKHELGHERVFFGEYGVNPQFNNPIGSRRNIRNAAFFAGSYPKRYKERCDDMEIIFNSILNAGGDLLIADRNFGSQSDELVYPACFQPSVLPPVEHSVLQKLHKLFRYNLNFNSIKQSPTMCAMRVYELQAQGNGFISNYANSVFNKFPGVRIIPYKQNMALDFSKNETWEEYESNTANIREVLDEKTSYQVVSKLLNNIGLESVVKEYDCVAVICLNITDSIQQSFDSQVYKNKILLTEDEAQNWSRLKEDHKIGYFCWFADLHQYEQYYLNDLINAFKYTNSKYITKDSYFDSDGNYVKGIEHEYVSRCSGKALTIYSARHFDPSDLKMYALDKEFSLEDGYSIDPFNLNYLKFKRSELELVEDYKLSVIVPVYNNGRFLASKCLPSLQRNDIWNDMEVILVDDGSTDNSTISMLKELDLKYSNVKIKLNHDGGSGSASRPRNQGIDLATAPLVTFLDPDNEICPGGYDVLFDLYKEANSISSVPVEFVSGFHVKVGEDVKTIGKHTPKRLSLIKDFKKGYFEKGRFPVIATQSAVISKDFINANSIRFVERSAGQDTLFGWELIAKAKCGAFNGSEYIIYYADRSDSITNVVNPTYFEKKLILEKHQKDFLQKNGLLNIFLEKRFDQFMEDWYLPKLEHVEKKNVAKCKEILDEICNIYQRKLSDYTE